MRKAHAFLIPSIFLRISSSYSAWALIVLLFGTAETHLPAAITSKFGQQAQDTGNFYFVDPAGAKSPLEPVTTTLTTTALIVPGDHSTVRFPAGTTFKFLMRLPAGAEPRFAELDSDENHRVYPIFLVGSRAFFATQRAKYATTVRFDLAPAADGFISLTPQARLQPGEYCIGHSQAPAAGCFGIDAAPAAGAPSVAVASSPPATAAPPPTISIGESSTRVLQEMGMPRQMIDLGSKKIYVYENMKIIFVGDKVTDVQ